MLMSAGGEVDEGGHAQLCLLLDALRGVLHWAVLGVSSETARMAPASASPALADDAVLVEAEPSASGQVLSGDSGQAPSGESGGALQSLVRAVWGTASATAGASRKVSEPALRRG